jgi:hypothetical protein
MASGPPRGYQQPNRPDDSVLGTCHRCRAFPKRCHGFRGSNDGTLIPPCMGSRIGADENPFGAGAKDER